MNDHHRIAHLVSQIEVFCDQEFSLRNDIDGEWGHLEDLANALNRLGEEFQLSRSAHKVLTQLNSQLWTANRRLEAISRVDPLTKLLNRRGLDAVLMQECERSVRQDSPISAVLIDCDDFKVINDTLGHSVGNQVLHEFAARMTAAVRTGDHIGRVGGDEFLAIMPDTRFHEAMVAAERIRIGISQHPLRLNDSTLEMTASMGVTTLPLSMNSIDDALSMTRLGLRRSKLSGKNRVTGRPADGTEDAEAIAHSDLIDDLRMGQYFHAVAQPILTVDNEDIVGFELFSRRNQGPYQMPAEFFRIALESDVLTDADLNCAKVCIKEATDRNLTGRLHVNLFPSTLLTTPAERLLDIFPPKRNGETYCIEISEQQFIGDPSALRDSLAALKDAGILVAVDDVGFGRTSLETLLVLEPDLIKIDRHYIAGIADDRVKSHRLERMVDAVGTLGAELVAEGVERREDLNVLSTLDLPLVQGYLWGQPV